MITIHYRPLAASREYDSIRLPVPPRRTDSYAACPVQFVQGRRGGKTAAALAWALENKAAFVGRPDPMLHSGYPRGIDGRPDPIGDQIARGPRSRARTTTEIPIAVDATLPAIAAALDRLKTSLRRNGTAAQLMAVDAIARAVEGVTENDS